MTFKNMMHCDLCGHLFQMGPHRYEGTWVPNYQMSFCRPCFASNWDGISPGQEATFIAHLTARNIALPKRNEKGWYPRGK